MWALCCGGVGGWVGVGGVVYVMTVGADRPVNSFIFESLSATSTCKPNGEPNSNPRMVAWRKVGEC